MSKYNGILSIESKNVFSILKKWLYSEQDIVFRELISNASDAIEKYDLISGNEEKNGDIYITIDKENSCLIISDNGIGMSYDELDKYINQIAFSGATEFINNHNDKATSSIIGHFGVGFYSSFMISDHVAIESKSYKEDEKAVRWDCNQDMSFEMREGSRNNHGTDVIIYLDENHPYLQNSEDVIKIIKKYFEFLKTPIYFNDLESEIIKINNIDPIWKRPEASIDKGEMNAFYREYFDDISDPLFWVKFESIDIGVRGIIFFRNTKNGKEELDGKFRIYNRGVYLGENIKEIVPKFVNLQSGIIECDNLSLVVSRSNIQDNKQTDMAALISECLSQEITIAMNDMFENKRSEYELFWPHLNAFVKYGVLQDKIFSSVMTRKVIFEDIHGNYCTIKEYLDSDECKNSTVYYSSDVLEQAHYIEIFRKCKLNALLFDHVIDQPFMRRQEIVHQGTRFVRIDSNIEDLFEGSINEEDYPKIDLLTEKFNKALGNRLGKMTLKITNLAQEDITTLIVNDEKARRMADMLEIYGVIKETDNAIKEIQSKSTYIINMSNPMINFIYTGKYEDLEDIVINHLFDIALMSQGTLELEDMEPFIQRSEILLSKIL